MTDQTATVIRLPRVKNDGRTLRERGHGDKPCDRCGRLTVWRCSICEVPLCLGEEDHFE